MTTSPETLFLKASREKYRFQAPQGLITAEMLWDLPLTTSKPNQACLNSIAVALHREIKELGEESFVDISPRQAERICLEDKLELVKFVIAARKEEARLASKKAATESLKTQIREAIARKKQEDLLSGSIEDLEAKLAALS